MGWMGDSTVVVRRRGSSPIVTMVDEETLRPTGTDPPSLLRSDCVRASTSIKEWNEP
jgi:hypothetical protein